LAAKGPTTNIFMSIAFFPGNFAVEFVKYSMGLCIGKNTQSTMYYHSTGHIDMFSAFRYYDETS